MNTYDVTVRNEQTGELRVIQVESAYGTDAQIEALARVFRLEGWRKALALVPPELQVTQA